MPRFTSIVCGLDVSVTGDAPAGAELTPPSAAALATATRLARDDGAALHLITALDAGVAGQWALEREKRAGHITAADRAAAHLERLAEGVRRPGSAVTSGVSLDGPADALLDDAASAHRDLIVVGTRERGAVARALLGSTSLALLRGSAVPVWVARSAFGERPPVVLAVVDVGGIAPRVVEMAADAARRASGTLHVLHVVDFAAEDVLRAGAADEAFIREYRSHRRAEAEREIPAMVAQAAGGFAADVRLPDGEIVPTILSTVDALRADLVVMGSIREARGHMALGRTAESVLPRIAASLLVLKPAPAA